ncbi:hypothetical protein H696_02494 [Fonticula alba]|uniref:C2 DOCK-type domain-containing protein n=1 Tax=Fonticula alba TaxID=691883 RepID=A0A058ZAY0_FONAL|nr:hypothetical protein H696_02494 [Fonticula alba]KCV71554.1 hypothetical protein H696_02494 [Fonticula alba]|eukprot:XP_009494677.1 hypothetical protein H696_02494 [Fonticula alba]
MPATSRDGAEEAAPSVAPLTPNASKQSAGDPLVRRRVVAAAPNNHLLSPRGNLAPGAMSPSGSPLMRRGSVAPILMMDPSARANKASLAAMDRLEAAPTELHYVEPMDFESVYMIKSKLIAEDPARAILVFPEDNIAYYRPERFQRTVRLPIPSVSLPSSISKRSSELSSQSSFLASLGPNAVSLYVRGLFDFFTRDWTVLARQYEHLSHYPSPYGPTDPTEKIEFLESLTVGGFEIDLLPDEEAPAPAATGSRNRPGSTYGTLSRTAGLSPGGAQSPGRPGSGGSSSSSSSASGAGAGPGSGGDLLSTVINTGGGSSLRRSATLSSRPTRRPPADRLDPSEADRLLFEMLSETGGSAGIDDSGHDLAAGGSADPTGPGGLPKLRIGSTEDVSIAVPGEGENSLLASRSRADYSSAMSLKSLLSATASGDTGVRVVNYGQLVFPTYRMLESPAFTAGPGDTGTAAPLSSTAPSSEVIHVPRPVGEPFGTQVGRRFLIEVFALDMGPTPEPWFGSLMLVDIAKRQRVSEVLHFHTNSESIMRRLRQGIQLNLDQQSQGERQVGGSSVTPASGAGVSSSNMSLADSSSGLFLPEEDDPACRSRRAMFELTQPSMDIFLVLRVDKVLEGDIEPIYDRYAPNAKSSLAPTVEQVENLCTRLGRFRQPYAWGAMRLLSTETGLSAEAVPHPAGAASPAFPGIGSDLSLNFGLTHAGGSQLASSASSTSDAASGSGSSLPRSSSATSGSQFTTIQSSMSDLSDPSLSGGQPAIAPTSSCDLLEGTDRLSMRGLFRYEDSRCADEEIFSYLSQFVSTSGQCPTTGAPVASGAAAVAAAAAAVSSSSKRASARNRRTVSGVLQFHMREVDAMVQVPNSLTPSLAPVKPYADVNPLKIVREVGEFTTSQSGRQHMEFVNLLYVYPQMVNMSRWTGGRDNARNIAIRMQFVPTSVGGSSSPTAAPGSNALKALFGRAPGQSFVSEVYSAVSFHEKAPQFFDEFKVALPLNLLSAANEYHCLFTFYHIGCKPRKTLRSEHLLGYSWLHLRRDGAIIPDGEYHLPVATEINSSTPYDAEGADHKWLESRRPVFTLRTRLVSSIYTQDRALDRFFSALDFVAAQPESVTRLVDALRGLAKVSRPVLAQYSSVVLDSLLNLLTCTSAPGFGGAAAAAAASGPTAAIPAAALGALLDVLSTLSSGGATGAGNAHGAHSHGPSHAAAPAHAWRHPDLVSYIRYRVHNRTMAQAAAAASSPSSPTAPSPTLLDAQPDQAELFQVVVDLLLRALTDPGFLSRDHRNHLLRYAWFLFDVCIKSVLQYLHDEVGWTSAAAVTGQAPRGLPLTFTHQLNQLFDAMIAHLLKDYKSNYAAVRDFNTSLSYFIGDLASFLDKRSVFRFAELHCQRISYNQSAPLLLLKFDMLKIVCSHEHFVALNLPTSDYLRRPMGGVAPLYPEGREFPLRGAGSMASMGSVGSISDAAPGPGASSASPGAGSLLANGALGLAQSVASALMSGLSSVTAGHGGSAAGSPTLDSLSGGSPPGTNDLQDEFWRRHYLAGLLIHEVGLMLEHQQQEPRSNAVFVLRDIIGKLDADPRFDTADKRARLGAIFFPIIPRIVRCAPALRKALVSASLDTPPKADSSSRRPISAAAASAAAAAAAAAKRDAAVADGESAFGEHDSAALAPESSSAYDFSLAEARALLLVFMTVLRHTHLDCLTEWLFEHCSRSDFASFFDTLSCASHIFQYLGQRHITRERAALLGEAGAAAAAVAGLSPADLAAGLHGASPVPSPVGGFGGPPSPGPFGFGSGSGTPSDASSSSAAGSNTSSKRLSMSILLPEDAVINPAPAAFLGGSPAAGGDLPAGGPVITGAGTIGRRSRSSSIGARMAAGGQRLSTGSPGGSGPGSRPSSSGGLPGGNGRHLAELVAEPKLRAVLAMEVQSITLDILLAVVSSRPAAWFLASEYASLADASRAEPGVGAGGSHAALTETALDTPVRLLHPRLAPIFELLSAMLSLHSSDRVIRLQLVALKSFIFRFRDAIFQEGTPYSADICCIVMRYCASTQTPVRQYASALLYLMLRLGFEATGYRNVARVGLQATVALSRLELRDAQYIRKAFATILQYAAVDPAVHATSSPGADGASGTGAGGSSGPASALAKLPGFVHDVVTKLFHISRDSVAMLQEQHSRDPDALADMYCRLQQSYAAVPDMQLHWLERLFQLNMREELFYEAALSQLHAAAIVARHLPRAADFGVIQDMEAYIRISPNISPAAGADTVTGGGPGVTGGPGAGAASEMEQVLTTGSSLFTDTSYIKQIEIAIRFLRKERCYEALINVPKLLFPIHEKTRRYNRLITLHQQSSQDMASLCEQLQRGSQLAPSYYMLNHFGQAFGDLAGREFIVREKRLVRLAELSQTLKTSYERIFGVEVEVIPEATVDKAGLEPDKAYLQVTFVEPYFPPEEQSRRSNFERYTNVCRFFYETPFTLSGKARGATSEQHLRQTILTTERHFPYIKRRLRVIHREQVELLPIQVATMALRKQATFLAEATNRRDAVQMQLQLQGSVLPQVNAGPLEFAASFMKPEVITAHSVEDVNALSAAFVALLGSCTTALNVNQGLVKADQQVYQDQMRDGLRRLREGLIPYIITADEYVASGTVSGLPTPDLDDVPSGPPPPVVPVAAAAAAAAPAATGPPEPRTASSESDL